MDMRLTVIRVAGAVIGVLALIGGLRAVYLGAAGTLGDAAASIDPEALAIFDNHFRFFAGGMILAGVASILGSIKIKDRPDIFQVGLEVIFVGGLARAFGFTEYGVLGPVLVPTIIEIVVPVPLIAMLKMHQKGAAAQAA